MIGMLTLLLSGHTLYELNMSDRSKDKRQPRPNGIRSRKELLELHRIVIKEAQNKSSEEGFQDLIASGIYTSD